MTRSASLSMKDLELLKFLGDFSDMLSLDVEGLFPVCSNLIDSLSSCPDDSKEIRFASRPFSLRKVKGGRFCLTFSKGFFEALKDSHRRRSGFRRPLGNK